MIEVVDKFFVELNEERHVNRAGQTGKLVSENLINIYLVNWVSGQIETHTVWSLERLEDLQFFENEDDWAYFINAHRER